MDDLAEAADANLMTHSSWLQRRLPGMRVVDEAGLTLVDPLTSKSRPVPASAAAISRRPSGWIS